MHSIISPYRSLQTGSLRQDVRPLVLRAFALLAAGALTLLACTAVAHSQQPESGLTAQTASPTPQPLSPGDSVAAKADKFAAARLPTAEAMRQQLAAAEVTTARLSPPAAGQPGEAGAEPGAAAHHGDVTMHGHWVIELRNKDGELADRREFDNSYVGGNTMGLALAGYLVAIDPAILISSATSTSASWCNSAYQNSCIIFNNSTIGHGGWDSAASLCAIQCYTGLTSTLTPDGSGGYNSYVLLGTISAIGSGTFDTVGTTLGVCFSSSLTSQTSLSSYVCYANAVSYATSPQPGISYQNGGLTSKNIGTMTVTAGQMLTFKVTISFS